MLRSGINNRKFSRLAEALGITRFAAIGLAECLWHLTATQAPQGDIGKLSDAEIAAGVFWPKRSAARLIEALSSPEVRLLDSCKCHRKRVHDWSCHADQSVRKTLARNGKSFLQCYLSECVSGHVPDSFRNHSGLPEPEPEPEPETIGGLKLQAGGEAAESLVEQPPAEDTRPTTKANGQSPTTASERRAERLLDLAAALGMLWREDVPQHRALARVVAELTAQQCGISLPDDGPPEVSDAHQQAATEIMRAISTTRAGTAMDSLDIRQVSATWAHVTASHAASRWARDCGLSI